jgi:hypothetical protein
MSTAGTHIGLPYYKAFLSEPELLEGSALRKMEYAGGRNRVCQTDGGFQKGNTNSAALTLASCLHFASPLCNAIVMIALPVRTKSRAFSDITQIGERTFCREEAVAGESALVCSRDTVRIVRLERFAFTAPGENAGRAQGIHNPGIFDGERNHGH